MKFIWEDKELYKKGKQLLLNFLTKKFNFQSIENVENILDSNLDTKIKLSKLKEIFIGKAKLNSPKRIAANESSWIIYTDKEYTGWSVFDAYNLILLINNNDKMPELKNVYTFKFSTMIDITPPLLFNIKHQFNDKDFLYANIEDASSDLFNGISQLLSLENAINYKSNKFIDEFIDNKFLLITIFMAACHFNNIDNMFRKIYDVCATGGYLLIKEHNLPTYGRDKVYFYETIYNLYRILYNEIFNKKFMKENNIYHYKTQYEWIEYISSFGFTPVAINILHDTNHYYDGFIMLFIKL